MAQVSTLSASTYLPLPDLQAGRPIRLFDLEPGRMETRLRGSLRIENLEKSPEYEALSYTWGASTQGRTLSIRDSFSEFRVPITDNLFRALRRLRSPSTPRVLWIDALCINQNNHIERGKQVAVMGHIFQQALRVLVWLGDTSRALSPTISTTISLNEVWEASAGQQENSPYDVYADALERSIEQSQPKWYDRAWVLQEFVLAREVLLCFGPITAPFDSLDWLRLYKVYEIRQAYRHVETLFMSLRDMQQSREQFLRGQLSLMDAFISHNSLCATVLSDNIYSLLGIINEDEALANTPDYSISPAAVFARATYASISVYTTWHCLELVTLNSTRRIPDLPSWVVDFSQGGIILLPSPLTKIPLALRATPLSPSLHTKSSTSPRLSICGAVVDSIYQTMPIDYTLTPDLEEPFLLARNMAHTFLNRSRRKGFMILHNVRDDISAFGRLYAVFTMWNQLVGMADFHKQHEMSRFWDYATWATGCEGGYPSQQACIFGTDRGFIGLVPETVSVEDIIVVFPQAEWPVILHPAGQHWVFKGLAMVNGLADECPWRFWEEETLDVREITLI